MSRAFVKESEDGGADALPELAISPHRNLVTPVGLAQIEDRLKVLQEELQQARQATDKATLARAERDHRYWSARRQTAEVVPLPAAADVVRFGAIVSLEDDAGRQVRYQIVGEDESDPGAGKISYVSPLGKAVLGCAAGDEPVVDGRVWSVVGIDVPDASA